MGRGRVVAMGCLYVPNMSLPAGQTYGPKTILLKSCFVFLSFKLAQTRLEDAQLICSYTFGAFTKRKSQSVCVLLQAQVECHAAVSRNTLGAASVIDYAKHTKSKSLTANRTFT